jgi:hypothetical protein
MTKVVSFVDPRCLLGPSTMEDPTQPHRRGPMPPAEELTPSPMEDQKHSTRRRHHHRRRFTPVLHQEDYQICMRTTKRLPAPRRRGIRHHHTSHHGDLQPPDRTTTSRRDGELEAKPQIHPVTSVSPTHSDQSSTPAPPDSDTTNP